MSSLTVRALPDAVKRLPFAAVPHAVAADPRLAPVDVRVIAALLFWAREKASCWPCDRSIAARVGRSIPTVQRALRRLQGLGVIGRDKVEPSDANRTGRVIRLRWRSAPRSPMIAPPRSPVIDPPRSSVIDEGIQKGGEKERPSSDEGSGSPPPPAGEGEHNDVAELVALAEGGGPFAAVARKRLAELAPIPCPAEVARDSVKVEESPEAPEPCKTRGPEAVVRVGETSCESAATQPRVPRVPRPAVRAPAQVPDRVDPTMRKPLSQHLGCVGVAHLLGDVITWPRNPIPAGRPHPRISAGP